MATNTEYVKFSDFVSGLSSLDADEKNGANIPTADASGNPKKECLGNYEGARQLSVVSNPEYAYAIVDANGAFLFGIKADGSIEWQKGIPQTIKDEFSETIAHIESELTNKVDKVDGKSLIDSVYGSAQSNSSNPEFLKIITDSASKIIEAINNYGQHEFFTRPKFNSGVDWSSQNLTELEVALKNNGFSGGQGDWSDAEYLQISKPKCAIVNFSNISAMPTTKTQNLNGVIQFWDMNGNYFRKKVIMNAQGSSSLLYPKKNIAIDFANEDWSDDGAFVLKIGDWVSQDSFHLKASYGDYFRCVGTICYDILDEMMKTRGVSYDAPWKRALIDQDNYTSGRGLGYGAESNTSLRLDTGAKNHPMGFPCVVFLNGSFYGIYAWSLKKDRDNYHQDKNNLKHIHIDGESSTEYLFNGSIGWNHIEIRNPSGLKDVDGNKYDKDNPKELSGTDANSLQVKNAIIALSNAMGIIRTSANNYGVNSEELKTTYEAYFDVDNIIDYVVFSDIINNVDGWRTNWQWLTYDGIKWWVCPYDLDRSFGTSTGYPNDLLTTHMMVVDTLPHYYVIQNNEYNARLLERYKSMRDKGIFSIDNFIGKMNEFIQNVGFEFYKKEMSDEHWGECPNNSNMVVDTEYWEMVLEDGKPVYSNYKNYSSSKTYEVGDFSFYGASKTFGYYKFKCVKQSTGNAPISKFAFRDSIWRLRKWLEEHFNNMDSLYNYTGE